MLLPAALGNARMHLLDALFPRRKALRELRARWGEPGNKDAWLAGEYFELTRDESARASVDDKTWTDLEFPKIFASVDSTVSPVGSQVLFRQMREYVDDADALARKHAVHAVLRTDMPAREALQAALLPLQDEQHVRIAGFIFGELPPPLRWRGLLHAWALASLAAFAGALVWPWLVWIWLTMLLVNAIVLARIGISGRTLRDAQTLEACLRLVKVADDLAALRARYPWLPQLAGLHDAAPQRARLGKTSGWLLVWLSLEKMFPISIVAMFLNVALLAKLVLHMRAMWQFVALRGSLAASFRLVGEVDAAIAVASWLEGHPGHCRPVITDRNVLAIDAGWHPLLTGGVANTVRLDGRSALVTGSNMAGKTTFIKMLGVNAVLAQTLGFCMAASATVPNARVMASIQAAHSVAAGKSHYFSEVETIRSFLTQQACGGRTIFVIDELFSGTNTVERVAIARAVLESLGRDSLVLATTHDVELQAWLQDHYDPYHFQESPEVDGFFDYKLRAGPAVARNAIRLLGEVGFPDAVIAKAMQYAVEAPACTHAAPDLRGWCAAVTLPASLLRVAAMPRQAVHSDSAPKAIGPYSQAVRAGDTLYLSGQTPLDPATGEMVPGGIDAQATRVFENLKAVLGAAGASFDDVVRVAIYMTDLGNFGTVNEVMKRYFHEPYPARSTIGVAALPRGAAVEIDVIAVPGR